MGHLIMFLLGAIFMALGFYVSPCFFILVLLIVLFMLFGSSLFGRGHGDESDREC